MNKTEKLEHARDLLNARLQDKTPADSIIAELDALLGPLREEIDDPTPIHQIQPGGKPGQAGPWNLHEELGEGGMGIVYRATRIDQPELIAALKILRCNRQDFCRAFERERRIVARLNHPNIPHFLDAGFLPDGRPWLAMEYVKGTTLLEHCNQADLDFKARLKIILKICNALRHAHQNMIIHRDIKPGNILIDPRGKPKLLDFGIAQNIDPMTLSLDGSKTSNLLTPEYAAPEMVMGEGLNAATDVYSLGVLLFEAITGRRPYRVQGSTQDIKEAICHSNIEKPSVLCSENDSPVTIPRIYRRDFDKIMAKALARDRKDRYVSAADLSHDLIAMLKGQPVQAHLGSIPYRCGKFVLRHTWGVAGMTIFIGSLIAFALAMAHQRDLIEIERQKVVEEHAAADSVANFMISLFEEANPDGSRGDKLTAKEVLDQGYKRIVKDLEEHKPLRSRLQLAMAEAYLAIGDFDKAEPLIDESLAFFRTTPEDVLYVKVLQAKAELEIHKGNIEEGTNLATDARKAAEKLDDPALLNKSLLLEGSFIGRNGDLKEAEKFLRKGLEGHIQHFGEGHQRLKAAYNQLGYNLHKQRRYKEAIPYYEKCIAISEADTTQEDPSLAIYLNNLALAYRRTGNLEKSEELLKKAIVGFEENWGREHYHTAAALNNLGTLYTRKRQFEEAHKLLQEVYEIRIKPFGPRHPDVAHVLDNIAWAYRREGKFKEAEQHYRSAHSIYKQAYGEEHNKTMSVAMNLAKLYFQMDDIDAALLLANKAIDFYAIKKTYRYPNTLGTVANELLSAGRHEEALLYATRLMELEPENYSPRIMGLQYHRVGQIYYRTENYEASITAYKDAIKLREKSLGRADSRTLRSINNLGLVYTAVGELDKAQSLLEENLEGRLKRYDKQSQRVTTGQYNLAVLHYLKRDYEKAEEHANQARLVLDKRYDKDHYRQINLLALDTAIKAQQGQGTNAEAILKDAYKKAKTQKDFLPQHSKVIARFLVDFYRKYDRHRDAEPWIPKAIHLL